MGYTHYWTQTRDFTDAEWSAVQALTRALIKAARSRQVAIVTGWDGTGQPKITDNVISLNGSPSCETFMLTREAPQEDPWGFCKTQGLPYDAVVVALLAGAREIAPGALELSSDGGEVFNNPVLKLT